MNSAPPQSPPGTAPPNERICPVCQNRYDAAANQFCPNEGSLLIDPVELAAARGDRMLGRRVDQFALAARIGVGGMGAVYRAIQVGVDRPVAVKVLHRDLLGNAEVVQRFLQEARASARLQHRYVATTYTSGRTSDGIPYIAMEYVPGGSLRQLIDSSFAGDVEDAPAGAELPYGLTVERALRLCNQVVAALTQAHRLGIVHRDLKPDNVLLGHDPDEGEQAKIVDFGIAKIVDREGMFQTKERSLLGTALYMAPELFQSAAADPRMDVYAVGLLLYELLTGFLPFEKHRGERATPMVLVNRRVIAPAPRLVLPGGVTASRELTNLVAALLELEPLHRPANASEVRDRLREVPELAPVAQAPSAIVPAAVLAAAGVPIQQPVLAAQPGGRPVAQALDVSALLTGLPGVDVTTPGLSPAPDHVEVTAVGARPAPLSAEELARHPRMGAVHDDVTKTLVQPPERGGFDDPLVDRGTAPVGGPLEARMTAPSGILDLRGGGRVNAPAAAAVSGPQAPSGGPSGPSLPIPSDLRSDLRATVVRPAAATQTKPPQPTQVNADRSLRETQVQPTATKLLPPRQSPQPAQPAQPGGRAERVTARPRQDLWMYLLGISLVLLTVVAILLAKVLF